MGLLRKNRKQKKNGLFPKHKYYGGGNSENKRVIFPNQKSDIEGSKEESASEKEAERTIFAIFLFLLVNYLNSDSKKEESKPEKIEKYLLKYRGIFRIFTNVELTREYYSDLSLLSEELIEEGKSLKSIKRAHTIDAIKTIFWHWIYKLQAVITGILQINVNS